MAIVRSYARPGSEWRASDRVSVSALRISGALLGLGLALLPAAAAGDPTDESPGQERIDPDFAAGKAAIAARDWPAAIRSLSSAALRDTRNADIQNYLGYAYRQIGQLDLAFTHYRRALQLDPRHRGAHEYVGEAYLIAGNLAKAEEHLAALGRICLIPCEEYGDLEKAIADYRRQHPPK
jgi:tetratricopeptide (TPR) repeat protein